MEHDLAAEVRRVSRSLLAFDKVARTLTFRPAGATPVGIAVDEQALRNWLQVVLLSAPHPAGAATRAQPHERAIEQLLGSLLERHRGGRDPFGAYRGPTAAYAPLKASAG